MSKHTRRLSAAIARFEHKARFENKLSREEIAAKLRSLREDGREFAREKLLAKYGN